MDKNYYEILEIDKNASPEIIEKAYKTLAKKYHPDVQSKENKERSEEIFKQINEAYEMLSDTIKKEKYNKTLFSNFVKIEDFNNLKNENSYLKAQNIKLQTFIDNNYYSNPTINNPKNIKTQNNCTPKPPQHLYTKVRRPTTNTPNYLNKMPNAIKNLVAILLTLTIIIIILNTPFINNIITTNIVFKTFDKFFS